MSKTKKWSKKKKIAVISASVVAVLLALVLIAGALVLKWYCTVPDYEQLKTNSPVTLIAHRGYSSEAPENTAPAFEKAAQAGYWGAECDIYMTADGQWVVTHDPIIYRVTGKLEWIEKMTYSQLQERTINHGANINDYPDLKFCSLDEYMQICANAGMTPVIELKGKNNTQHYDKIIETVDKYPQVEPVYISFQYENLQKIRALTDARVYYLVKEITDEDIQLAKDIENCGIDFDSNKEKNFESGAIDRCKDEGLALAAWTVDSLELMDKLVANGVDVITTNCISKGE